jgi:hypothetical protein
MARQAGQTIDPAVADAIVPGVIAASGDRDRVLYKRRAAVYLPAGARLRTGGH